MTKQEVQQRVLKNGKPLDIDLFTWDEKTKAFSSLENGLVIDFKDVSNCTFKTGSVCTFKTGYDCTFKTGYDCTFDTGSVCTFKTGSVCTFKTGYNCTFKTGSVCVIVRRDIFDVIQPKEKEQIKLCPYEVKGYISKLEGEDKYHMDMDGERVRHEIIDGILSRVVSEHGNVMKVINHGETEESFIVTDGINHAHGKTIDEARESLIYKISDRDTSKYKGLTLESVVTLEEGIKMYRTITGACESQTKEFVNNLSDKKSEYSIKEILKITQGRYNHEVIAKFFSN